MPLPKTKHILFKLTVPTTKEVVTFRPYVVREEMLLLVAKESKKLSEIVDAIRQIIVNCCEDEKGIDITKLSLIDLEYLFIKLRAASVNNIQEIDIFDKEEMKEEGQKTKPRTCSINLNEIEVIFPENHSNQVVIDEEMTLSLKFPTASISANVLDNPNGFKSVMNILKDCLVSLHTKDEIFKFADFTELEIDNFLESLGHPVYERIKEFFNTLPKLNYKMEYTNNLGHNRVIIWDKLEDFFPMG